MVTTRGVCVLGDSLIAASNTRSWASVNLWLRSLRRCNRSDRTSWTGCTSTMAESEGDSLNLFCRMERHAKGLPSAGLTSSGSVETTRRTLGDSPCVGSQPSFLPPPVSSSWSRLSRNTVRRPVLHVFMACSKYSFSFSTSSLDGSAAASDDMACSCWQRLFRRSAKLEDAGDVPRKRMTTASVGELRACATLSAASAMRYVFPDPEAP